MYTVLADNIMKRFHLKNIVKLFMTHISKLLKCFCKNVKRFTLKYTF